jgi:hypothetical protein
MIALLPLLVQLAGAFGPTLTRMLLGQKAGVVVGTIIDVARKTFGSDDPAAIAAAAKNDPNLVQLYIEGLKAETEQFKASLADVADARTQTVRLAQLGSVIAWGAPIISVVVVAGFVILLGLWLFHPPTSDQTVLAVLNTLVGTLAAAFGAVVQYWLGSSAGSARKDALLIGAKMRSEQDGG